MRGRAPAIQSAEEVTGGSWQPVQRRRAAGLGRLLDGDTVRVDFEGGERNLPVRYIGIGPGREEIITQGEVA